MNDKQVVASGIGFNNLLFITFLVLKLTNVISWSWWWVTAPLWMPLLIILALCGVLVAIAVFKDNTYTRKRKVKCL